MQDDFKQYLLEDDKIMDEIDKTHEEYNEAVKKSNEEFDDLIKDFNQDEIIRKLKVLKDTAIRVNRPDLATKYDIIISDIDGAITLKYLFDTTEKMKNPHKIIEQAENSYTKEYKKFYEKISTNQSYFFKNPEYLEKILQEELSDVVVCGVRYLLYSFFRFVNTKPERVSTHAIFIDNFMKNIYYLQEREEDMFPRREEFKSNVEKYILMFM